MGERHTILEKEGIVRTSSSNLNLSIQILEGDISADLQNIEHILVVPEYREQTPGRGRRKGVHCIKERDNILLSRNGVQRLCICERRTECRGCVRGRVEKQKAGRRPAVCWEVVNEHEVISLNIYARPEVAGLEGAGMLWCGI